MATNDLGYFAPRDQKRVREPRPEIDAYRERYATDFKWSLREIARDLNISYQTLYTYTKYFEWVRPESVSRQQRVQQYLNTVHHRVKHEKGAPPPPQDHAVMLPGEWKKNAYTEEALRIVLVRIDRACAQVDATERTLTADVIAFTICRPVAMVKAALELREKDES